MTPDEVLNKIWNPEYPVLLIDRELTQKELDIIAASDCLEDLYVVEARLLSTVPSISDEIPNLQRGAGFLCCGVKVLDHHFQRRVYGCALYARQRPVYFFGALDYTLNKIDSCDWSYVSENPDTAALARHIELTHNLIKKRSY